MNISIKYVNFPKPGGKYGSLKLTDGATTIWAPPDLLGLFRAGMTCEIGTKEQVWGQGGDARNVTIATTGPLQGSTGPVQGPVGQGMYQGGVSRETSPRANTGFQPRVYEGGVASAQAGGPPHDQARDIYVTGVVGRAMGSGKFAASEIPVLTQAAMLGYELLRRPKQTEPGPEPDPPGMEPGDPGPEPM